MAKLLVVLTHDEIQSEIPYSVVCSLWSCLEHRAQKAPVGC